MKKQTFFTYQSLVNVLASAALVNSVWATPIAAAHTAPASELASGVDSIEGGMEHVVCSSKPTVSVRDESLAQPLFNAEKFETAIPVQSFGTDTKEMMLDGRNYTFIKVQFPRRPFGQNVGWVAENQIQLKSACPNPAEQKQEQAAAFAQDVSEPVATVAHATPAPTTGSSAGWTFPTIARPTHTYKGGMMAFGARRGGGTRTHAACDLYRYTGEQAVAVAAGTIVRDRYYFYQGTYAMEVRHTGGRIVRYGEITGKAAPGVAAGRTVKIGQTIGFIGKVNSNCCRPMLHFEMYSGTRSGSLSTGGNKYQRRSDLMNPTTLLASWEKAKFGKSW